MTSVLIAKIAIAVSLIGIAIYRDCKNEKEYQENKWYFDKLRADVYDFMKETREEKKAKEGHEKKQVPPFTPFTSIHLNAGRDGYRRDEDGRLRSYTNGDALMDIFRNSGMDIRPNSCPNCTHEIESKDAIFCSHCGKRLRKE